MKNYFYPLLLFLLGGSVAWSQQIGGAPILPYSLTVDDTVACSYGETITATLANSQIKTAYYLRSATNDVVMDGPVQGTGGPIQFSIYPYQTDSFYVDAVAPGIGVELDETDDAIEVHPNPDISSGDFSLMGWIKIAPTGPNFGYINTFSRPVGITRYLQLLHFYGRLRYLSGTGSTPAANSLIGNRSIKDNEWHHFAFTRTAATNEVNIYIDGVLDASKVIPALETGLDTCFIGHNWVNGSRQGHLGAGIDELSFWSRPLSLAEIQDDMANGTDSTDTDLVYFYNFEEGQGDSVQIQAPTSLTYSWPQGLANGQNFAPDSTDDYTVIGTDANGCRDTATTTIVVNSLPQVQLQGPANNGVCFGESVILSASGANSYSWDNGVVDGQSFTPQSAQSYTVTATDTNACQNTASIFVDVYALPALVLFLT